MCCKSEGHHDCGGNHSCGCGCGCGSQYKPRFLTREQQLHQLECYLEALQTEVQAVEEHIADLRSKSKK
jgi:hypothetical protein